jgi:hypothetical protein
MRAIFAAGVLDGLAQAGFFPFDLAIPARSTRTTRRVSRSRRRRWGGARPRERRQGLGTRRIHLRHPGSDRIARFVYRPPPFRRIV